LDRDKVESLVSCSGEKKKKKGKTKLINRDWGGEKTQLFPLTPQENRKGGKGGLYSRWEERRPASEGN